MAANPRADVALVLKGLRERERLNQAGLAKLAGLSRGAIGLIERGQSLPMPETLHLLARGLATDADGNLDAHKLADYQGRLMRAARHTFNGESEAERAARVQHVFYAFVQKYPGIETRLRLLQTRELSEKGIRAIESVLEQICDSSPPADDKPTT